MIMDQTIDNESNIFNTKSGTDKECKTERSTEIERLKLKYTKQNALKNVLDCSKIKILHYKADDIEKLKQKYKTKKPTRTLIDYNKIKRSLNINEDDELCNTNTENGSRNINTEEQSVETIKISTQKKVVFNTKLNREISPEPEKLHSSEDNSEKMNAFQLMMNNRHKSIGANSPGKERKEDEVDEEAVSEKKVKLNKRKSVLEEWANRRGNRAKRKLEDEAQERYISKTLNERAKHLKEMLLIPHKAVHDDDDSSSDSFELHLTKRMKRVTCIADSDSSVSDGKSTSSDLIVSYFTNKTDRTSKSSENTRDVSQMAVDTPKTRKSKKDDKGRKSSLSLKSIEESKNPVSLEDGKSNSTVADSEDIFPASYNPKTLKKQTQLKISNVNLNTEVQKGTAVESATFTPRTWRMKVRLREKENVNSEEVLVVDDRIVNKETECSTSQSFNVNSTKQNKNVKLAPMFLKKTKKDPVFLEAKKKFLQSGVPSKIRKLMVKQTSFQDIEVDVFPKISHVQQRKTDEVFPEFWDLPNVSLSLSIAEEESDASIKMYRSIFQIGTFTECRSVFAVCVKRERMHTRPARLPNLKQLVQEVKSECPNYPVYKFFRSLRRMYGGNTDLVDTIVTVSKSTSKSESVKKITTQKEKRRKGKKRPEVLVNESLDALNTELSQSQRNSPADADLLMWTEKYKPQSHEDIVGNTIAVEQLKAWLESWLVYSEDRNRKKKRTRLNSDSASDFCSDSDTRDTDCSLRNTLVVVGPHGSGKTSAVYALCNQLNINVLEINASSKRPGKKILQELQEATQSHQVKNADTKAISRFVQGGDADLAEGGNAKAHAMCLLLVEDVDIVFEEQDDGFITALSSLVSSSKRPIVVTASDAGCAHLQRFMSQYQTLVFHEASERAASPWLQLVCLLEGVHVERAMLGRLLHWLGGDVRRALLHLQFWVSTGGDPPLHATPPLQATPPLPRIALLSMHAATRTRTSLDTDTDTDTSNMSYVPSNHTDSHRIHHTCVDCFIPYLQKDQAAFQIPYPVKLGTLWWNLPDILGISHIQHKKVVQNSESTAKRETSPVLFPSTQEHQDNTDSMVRLIAASQVFDSIAFGDTVHTKLRLDCDLELEPASSYWHTTPVNSMSFLENVSTYNDSDQVSTEIVHWLIENNMKAACNNTPFELNMATPSPGERRWRSKQHQSMEGLMEAVPTSNVLDRRAVCQDYQSMLRSISRTENTRFVNNNKRKNRFYHYLKSLNVHLTDSMYEIVTNTLAPSDINL